MPILRKTLLLLVAVASTTLAAGVQPAYRIVVNPANPAAGLPRAEVARMFLKKVVAWPDGLPVTVIDLERSSAVRQAFSRDVHQRDAEAIAAHWQTAVFSGRDVPPPIARTDAEVLAFVRANPGALGYVSATAELAGVKALTLR